MIVWALTDERISGNNQSIAISEKLSSYYLVKKIKYHYISNLPIIKNTGFVLVNNLQSDDISNSFPDIIVCFGDRLGHVALDIKKKSGKRIFIINIGNSGFNPNKFDLILVSKHDRMPEKLLSRNNVIQIHGVLTKANNERINSEINRWGKFLNGYAKPVVTFLIGGDTKDYKYNPKEFGIMVSNLSNIMNKNYGTLLILASTRAGEECMKQLKQKINCDYCLYDTNWENDPNNLIKSPFGDPYYAFLNASDFIVITGDSMSRLSEVCSTGKTVYIYMPKNTLSPRHYTFCSDLVEDCYAREFNKNTNELEKFRCKTLCELDRVIDIICERIKEKNK